MKRKITCKPKLNKPFKIPTRHDILPIINRLKDDVVSRVFTKEELVNILGIAIGSTFKVDVRHAESHDVDQNDIDLNAYYDSGLDEAGDVSIELFLITNPFDECLSLDHRSFDTIAKRIADSITHEMIHMKQSRARDFLEVDRMAYIQFDDEVEEGKAYLGDPDEIDAYAFNIASELKDLPNCMEKLQNPSKIAISDSLNLYAYVNTFSKDMSNPIIKRLLKKVYKNLQAG